MKLEIIFKNDDYVFVNKPSGMLSIPDRLEPDLPNVKKILKQKFDEIFVVHRIDRDTSGCIVMALNPEAHREASMQFENRKVYKQYIGIVQGTPPYEKGICDMSIMEHPTIKGKMAVHAKMGKKAITEYQVLESFSGYTLMSYVIHTGRMHQIRVHSAQLGCPIVCDPIYGQAQGILISSLKRKYKLDRNLESEVPILNRLALHAFELKLENLDPIQAPMFKDMTATLAQMRKHILIERK
jgi:23S rRNA pseudouridine955/2504/2580 synthase/23S rRNA pseudouridine1911/1915/1917 synthase